MFQGDGFREATFVLGAVGGMLMFSIGLILLTLGLALGFRSVPVYPIPMPIGASLPVVAAFVVGNLGAGVAGVVIRRRDTDDETVRRAQLVLGTLVAFVGLLNLLVFFSAKDTVSAPYLVSATDKLLLLSLGLLGMYGGVLVIKWAARRVGF